MFVSVCAHTHHGGACFHGRMLPEACSQMVERSSWPTHTAHSFRFVKTDKGLAGEESVLTLTNLYSSNERQLMITKKYLKILPYLKEFHVEVLYLELPVWFHLL